MDKHLVFKQAILSVFEVYAEYLHAGHTSTVEYHTVADKKNDRYHLQRWVGSRIPASSMSFFKLT